MASDNTVAGGRCVQGLLNVSGGLTGLVIILFRCALKGPSHGGAWCPQRGFWGAQSGGKQRGRWGVPKWKGIHISDFVQFSICLFVSFMLFLGCL